MNVRQEILSDGVTDCCRVIHGASDGWPGWYVERLGNFFLSLSEFELRAEEVAKLEELVAGVPGAGAYHKTLNRDVRVASLEESCPQHVCGAEAPERFTVLENGVRFELSFREGYSVGLFLDQRENRRRILSGEVVQGFFLPAGGDARRELLNTFSYTCGFSVCAARAGYRATSLDLSKKYLDWGRRNFELNGIAPAEHDFIYGDCFDWMRRLAKKGRKFDVIILDPPSFSKSKESGFFRAEKDYGKLVVAALPLLNRDGVLLASTNLAKQPKEDFLFGVRGAIRAAGRRIAREFFAGQPADFPVSTDEPAYLKTVWLRIS